MFASGSNRSKRRDASTTFVDVLLERWRALSDWDRGWSQESRRAEQVVVLPRPERPATMMLREMTRGRSWRDSGSGGGRDDIDVEAEACLAEVG